GGEAELVLLAGTLVSGRQVRKGGEQEEEPFAEIAGWRPVRKGKGPGRVDQGHAGDHAGEPEEVQASVEPERPDRHRVPGDVRRVLARIGGPVEEVMDEEEE